MLLKSVSKWIFRVWYHVIAVYSEKKLQHYTTAYRNHRSAGEKLGLFRFFKFFMYFSANTLQPVQKSLFNWTATQLECSWQAVAYISHVEHWKSLNLCCLSKLFWHFQRLPNNIKRTITKVKVQQELLWMIISGYKHERKKRKWVRGNRFLKQFTVCELHKRFCISTCELLSKF